MSKQPPKDPPSNIRSLADRRRDILSIRELERVCELLVDEAEELNLRLAQAETRLFRQGARHLVLEETLARLTGQMEQLQEAHHTALQELLELQQLAKGRVAWVKPPEGT